MPTAYARGNEIVPGYTLIEKLGSGMSGEVWTARASGGVKVAIKVIRDLEMVGGKRELGALRVVREVKHPNLCPLFGIWFFDREGMLFDPTTTDQILCDDSDAHAATERPLHDGAVADATDTIAFENSAAVDPSQGTHDTLSLEPISNTPIDNDSIPAVTPRDSSTHPPPSKMVLAMGLGEQTLYDRLVQVQTERQLSESQPSTSPTDNGEPNGIEVDELLRYMSGAASAIDELNTRHQIYHCDIKPQNILIVGQQAQVCDFGLARQVEGGQQTQLAFGTPAYGAPEMLFGRTYSRTIDQYSLAMTYYHLRTGRLPSDGMTQSSYLKAKASGNLGLTRIRESEAKVIAQATDLEPDQRYKTCQEFVAALEHAVRAPTPAEKSNRKRFPLAVPAVILLVLGSIAAAFHFQSDASRDKSVAEIHDANSADSIEEVAIDPVGDDSGKPIAVMVGPVSTDTDRQGADSMAVESTEVESSSADPSMALSNSSEPDEIATMEPASDSTVDLDVARLSDPSVPEMRRPETMVPETMVPKQPVPSLDDSLASLLSSSPVTDETFDRLSQVLRATPSGTRDSVSKESVVTVLEPLGRFTSDQFWSADLGSDAGGVVLPGANALYQSLTSVVGPSRRDERDFHLPLALVRLQLAGMDPSTTSRALGAAMSGVRSALPEGERIDGLGADALLTLYQICQHPRSPAWDYQTAENDLSRAATFGTGDARFQSRLARCRGDQLIRLMRDRVRAPDVATLDVITRQVADRLREVPAWTSMAAAAGWLIRHADQVENDSADARLPESPPEQLPDDLLPLYQLAVGWSAWQSGETGLAFDSWKLVADDPLVQERVSLADRQRAAEYLIARVIRSSSVEDNDCTQMRYGTSHEFAALALNVSQALAPESRSVMRSVNEEMFLCAVASGDESEAETRWESIRETPDDLSPQFGYCLFRFADERLRKQGVQNDASSSLKWVDALVIGCQSQAKVAGDLSKESDQTESLFRNVFMPTLEKIRPLFEKASVDSSSPAPAFDSKRLATFARQFVRLAAVRHRRGSYPTLVAWWSDVERVAVFAGEKETDPDDRIEFFAVASDACLQSRREHETDVPFDAVTKKLSTYFGAAGEGIESLSQSDWLSEALEARVIARQVIRGRPAADPVGKYDDVIGRYDDAITEARKRNSTRLADLLRERSFLQIRKSRIVDPAKSAELQRDALADARNAIAADLPWHSNRELCLVNLADICGRVVAANIADKSKRIENNKLLDEGQKAIDEAIDRRRRDSFDYTHIALKKFVLLHFDLAVNRAVDPARFEEKKSEANQLISRYSRPGTSDPVETNLRAESDYLTCFWHSAVSQIYVDLELMKTAMSHTRPAYEIASQRLDEQERLYYKVLLQYVGQASALSAETLGSGRQPELAAELIAILRRIENPPPDIRDVQQQMIRVLQPHSR